MSDTELRELDAWIAEHLFGYRWFIFREGKSDQFVTLECLRDEWVKRHGGKPCEKPTSKDYKLDYGGPRYASDPAATMQVLSKCLAELGSTSLHMNNLGDKFIIYCGDVVNFSERVEASTLPLAICLFAKQLFSK